MTDTFNLRRGLVGQWSMDDRHLDTGEDVLKDSSGNGNHVELYGGVSTGSRSPVGEAFDFDGDDDYGLTPELPAFIGEGDLTVSVLFRLDEEVDNQGSAFMQDRTSDPYQGIEIRAGNNIRVGWSADETDTRTYVVISAEQDRWYWIGYEWDRDEELVTGYVDGKKETTIEGDADDAELMNDEPWNFAGAANMGGSPDENDVTIAYAGMWSRKLTSPERRMLTNMTGPQVMRI